MNVFGDICGIHTFGVLALSFETYQKCMTIAETKAKEITRIMREKLKHSEDFKLTSLTKNLEDMNIDSEINTENVIKQKKKFVKTIKDSIDTDFDNEQVDDKLVVDALKRQKIPKLGEDSSKRGSRQAKGKRDYKSKHKEQDEEMDEDDEEEEIVQMKSEFK